MESTPALQRHFSQERSSRGFLSPCAKYFLIEQALTGAYPCTELPERTVLTHWRVGHEITKTPILSLLLNSFRGRGLQTLDFPRRAITANCS